MGEAVSRPPPGRSGNGFRVPVFEHRVRAAMRLIFQDRRHSRVFLICHDGADQRACRDWTRRTPATGYLMRVDVVVEIEKSGRTA